MCGMIEIAKNHFYFMMIRFMVGSAQIFWVETFFSQRLKPSKNLKYIDKNVQQNSK